MCNMNNAASFLVIINISFVYNIDNKNGDIVKVSGCITQEKSVDN